MGFKIKKTENDTVSDANFHKTYKYHRVISQSLKHNKHPILKATI
jgi:hypothetical protein